MSDAPGAPRPVTSSRPPGAFTPWLVLLVGQLAVSTGAVFVRLADAPSLAISAWRCALSALILLPFGLRHASVASGGSTGLAGLSGRELTTGFLAGAALAVHFVTWIASLDYTTVASSVLLVNTGPLWVGLLSPLITGDRAGRRTWLGLVLAGIGVAWLAAGDELDPTAWRGNGLALIGGLALAVYLMLGRRLTQRLPTTSYLVLCYGSAALLLVVTALATGTPLFGYTRETTLFLLLIALVPQLIGHSCSNLALRWVAPIVVSLSLLGEPVFSSILAFLVLDEAPPERTLLAAPFVLAGVFLAATDRGRS